MSKIFDLGYICLLDSCSAGMPLPLNLYTFRDGPTDGPTGAGGVDGAWSSKLISMSLSEHKDGVGASVKEPDGHVPLVTVALESGGYEQDEEAVPSVRRPDESKLEPAAKLESADEIRKRRLGGGSEENVIIVHGKKSSSLLASSRILIVLRFLFSPRRLSDSGLAMFEAFKRGIVSCDFCKDDNLRKADCVLKRSEEGSAGLSLEDLSDTLRSLTVFISFRKAAILSAASPTVG